MKDKTMGDYDIWYKPCTHCGYDTAKSSIALPVKYCWKCGRSVRRDFSIRALKKIKRSK